MKKYIKQVKKGLAAFLAVVMVMGVSPVATVMAEEPERFLLSRTEGTFIFDESELTLYLDVVPEKMSHPVSGRNIFIVPIGTSLNITMYSGHHNLDDIFVVFDDWDGEIARNPGSVRGGGLRLGRTPAPDGEIDLPPGSVRDEKSLLGVYSPGGGGIQETYIFNTVGNFVVALRNGNSLANYNISVVESAQTQTATPTPTETQATPDTISVTINGTAVDFADQQPANIGGRVLVPVRDVFETLGFDVSWNQDLRQATLARANDTVVITVDSATFTTNGASHTLDVPAQNIGGRTMIPLRAVLESVGYTLNWNGDTQTVIITTN